LTDIVEHVSALLKVIVSKRSKERFFERPCKFDEEVQVESGHQEAILLRQTLEVFAVFSVLVDEGSLKFSESSEH
jgi:hypothetical protein